MWIKGKKKTRKYIVDTDEGLGRRTTMEALADYDQLSRMVVR